MRSHILFIAFNQKSELLKKKEVRQALSHAVNRKEMVDAFCQASLSLAPCTNFGLTIELKDLSIVQIKQRTLDSQGVLRMDIREFEARQLS